MAYDEIAPADYEKLNRVKPYLPELEKRSHDRVAASKDFAYVKEDIEIVKKAVAEKSVSLNEAQRLKEKNDQETRQQGRDRELKARKFPEEKIYDLTIKDDEVQMKLETNSLYAANSTVTDAASADKQDKSGAAKKTDAAKTAADTNSVASDTDSNNPETDEAAAEDKVPQVDVDLNEAESILSDYISLMHAETPLTAEQQKNP